MGVVGGGGVCGVGWGRCVVCGGGGGGVEVGVGGVGGVWCLCGVCVLCVWCVCGVLFVVVKINNIGADSLVANALTYNECK